MRAKNVGLMPVLLGLILAAPAAAEFAAPVAGGIRAETVLTAGALGGTDQISSGMLAAAEDAKSDDPEKGKGRGKGKGREHDKGKGLHKEKGKDQHKDKDKDRHKDKDKDHHKDKDKDRHKDKDQDKGKK